MIDIHTHILPGIDDGSKSFEHSILMAKEAQSAGFTDIITTSHYMTNVYEADTKTRIELIEKYRELLENKNINIKIYNGSEIYFSDDFPELIINGVIPTLAESNYVLFELPLQSKITYVESTIFKLRNMGYIPIIAHPERYVVVQNDIKLATNWIESGALLQLNYGSAIGFYGRHAKKTFYKLLKENMVTFLGSDNHRTDQIYATIPKIIKILNRKIGVERVKELTETNPRKIIEHQSLV